MGDRARLTAEQRRAQLLAVGAAAFAAEPYQDVEMSHVARSAGVSRALLYRHFPTKRDLFAAVWGAAATGLLSDTVLTPDLPLEDAVRARLEAHLRYFEANRHTVLAANRSLAGDPGIAAIRAEEFAGLRQRLVDVLQLDELHQATASAVVMSWLTFVHVLCLDWLETGTPDRDAVREICLGALFGALGALDLT